MLLSAQLMVKLSKKSVLVDEKIGRRGHILLVSFIINAFSTELKF